MIVSEGGRAEMQTREKEPATTSIAFVGFGEVASRLSAAVLANGGHVSAYDVLLETDAETLKRRAGDAPIEFGSLASVIAGSAIVLSTVTTDVALRAAAACEPHLRPDQTFVDLNATSPTIKRRIGDTIVGSGANFVEGAILGAIGVTGARTRILVCGEKAEPTAQTLTSLGLNVGFYGHQVGRASMFKLLRSVFSKGMEALLLETLLAARRAGSPKMFGTRSLRLWRRSPSRRLEQIGCVHTERLMLAATTRLCKSKSSCASSASTR